jgi:hypothetical protein
VVDGLEEDIDQMEHAMFGGGENLTEQIYVLKTEINDVYRAPTTSTGSRRRSSPSATS